MQREILVLVIYDITDDKRRRRINKILEGFGVRIQQSAFECWLDQYKFIKMQKYLEKWIDKETDKINIYKLSERNASIKWGLQISSKFIQCDVI